MEAELLKSPVIFWFAIATAAAEIPVPILAANVARDGVSFEDSKTARFVVSYGIGNIALE